MPLSVRVLQNAQPLPSGLTYNLALGIRDSVLEISGDRLELVTHLLRLLGPVQEVNQPIVVLMWSAVCGEFIGRGGANILCLRRGYGYNVVVTPNLIPGSQERRVFVCGPLVQSLQFAACHLVTEIPDQVCYVP